MGSSNIHDIVIVGGGIVGLATALALHMKGLKSLVLEKSETLRAHGTTVGVHSNGWRAFGQLGVADELRSKAGPILVTQEILLAADRIRFTEHDPAGEQRCVKRSDIMKAFADRLPVDTIRFNCRVVSIDKDQKTGNYALQMNDGSVVVAKIVIGCEGWQSLVAETLGFKSAKVSPLVGLRALTYYPEGHGYAKEFLRVRHNGYFIGRTPIDDNTISWFLARKRLPSDSEILYSPKGIVESTLEYVKGLPCEDIKGQAKRSELADMIRNSDLDTAVYTIIRYRTPWEIFFGNFRSGTMTVAGDAMHVMGPFLQQGGSSGLEDAIALARNLASELHQVRKEDGELEWRRKAEIGIDNYLKERKPRLLKLSTQSYLTGLMATISFTHVQIAIYMLILLLFRHSFKHTEFDIGRL
ncbi:monooxygenase 1-like [Aristolochia californica]|uniref:monooxygenase 1-like n=1 Tax=Aristolochia californica TaxID=171875 RepID=UPI0035DC13D6